MKLLRSMMKVTLYFCIGHLYAVMIEEKPIISSSSETSKKSAEFMQKIDLLLEQKDIVQSKIIDLFELSEQLIDKVDALKHKIDLLEKQQRDFLALISDVVMQPEQPIASQEHKDYQTTLDLMKMQQYPQALKALQKFLVDYPQSDKAPYAYYWIGEVYLLDNQYPLAKKCYSYLLNTYPLHHKAAEALFKIGQIDYTMGKNQEARKNWLEVIQRFPHSQASHLAKKYLTKVDHEHTP